jgi:hypothetical protein
MLSWLVSNKDWLLSGIGIAVPLAILGWWLQRRTSSASQSQRGGRNSVNVQVGGNFTIRDTSTAERAVRLGQFSQFRETIYHAAHAYDDHMEEANRCSERGDVDGGKAAILRAARSQGEIITAYTMNRHLFSASAITEIDKELTVAESGGDDALLYLITAIQLINTHSERERASMESDRQNC